MKDRFYIKWPEMAEVTLNFQTKQHTNIAYLSKIASISTKFVYEFFYYWLTVSNHIVILSLYKSPID